LEELVFLTRKAMEGNKSNKVPCPIILRTLEIRQGTFDCAYLLN